MAEGDFKTDEEFRAEQKLKEVFRQAIREMIPELVAALKGLSVRPMEESDGNPRPNQ